VCIRSGGSVPAINQTVVNIFIYICIHYICMYIYIYIYTNIHTSQSSLFCFVYQVSGGSVPAINQTVVNIYIYIYVYIIFVCIYTYIYKHPHIAIFSFLFRVSGKRRLRPGDHPDGCGNGPADRVGGGRDGGEWLSLSIYIYIHMCVYSYFYLHTHTHTHIYICICICICICIGLTLSADRVGGGRDGGELAENIICVTNFGLNASQYAMVEGGHCIAWPLQDIRLLIRGLCTRQYFSWQ